MVLTLHLVLLLVAAILFAIAGFGVSAGRSSLIACGLFALTLAFIFP